MPKQRGITLRNGEYVQTTGISFPDQKTQPSIKCSVYSCSAAFKQETNDPKHLLRDYAAAGWSYHYTPRGIRPVCPAHRILVDQTNAAL